MQRAIAGDAPQKAGPGQILRPELVAAPSGFGQIKRVRNIGASPLELAKSKGKISEREYQAGTLYARLFSLRFASGKDSTDMDSCGSGSNEPWTQTQANALHDLGAIDSKLSAADCAILRHFAGEGCSIAESVQRVVPCHPSGVIYRLREALTHLSDILAGFALRSYSRLK